MQARQYPAATLERVDFGNGPVPVPRLRSVSIPRHIAANARVGTNLLRETRDALKHPNYLFVADTTLGEYRQHIAPLTAAIFWYADAMRGEACRLELLDLVQDPHFVRQVAVMRRLHEEMLHSFVPRDAQWWGNRLPEIGADLFKLLTAACELKTRMDKAVAAYNAYTRDSRRMVRRRGVGVDADALDVAAALSATDVHGFELCNPMYER